MPVWLENLLLTAADPLFAAVPQRVPSTARLRQCRIIAHRGAHDNRRIIENTLPAFDALLDTGIWGLETDIRWTRDLEPVLIHDPDTARLFGDRARVGDLDLKALRRHFPAIPVLTELVARCAGHLHLMLEIKTGTYPDPARQDARLQAVLAPLTPGRDYHLLALDPGLFRYLPSVPPEALVPVAQLNVSKMSAIALSACHAGIAAPYLNLRRRVIETHRNAGQYVGVGFPRSRNSLYRELNRGVDWIFTERALRLQRILDRALNRN